MRWSFLTEVRHAHLRARLAERSAEWHLVIKEYLFCLEAAERAQDVRAIRFFALQLSQAYSAIGMLHKAERYRELGAVPTELR
jgi:hypothetical protein